MPGIYTAALCTCAAVAAGATEPLRIAFGDAWQPALAFRAIPALIAVRARDADIAARLSGMAQSVGYSMAGLGAGRQLYVLDH